MHTLYIELEKFFYIYSMCSFTLRRRSSRLIIDSDLVVLVSVVQYCHTFYRGMHFSAKRGIALSLIHI